MQIIITGGGGFLGQRLAKALLKTTLPFDELVLVDVNKPANPVGDARVRCQQADLAEAGVAESLLTPRTEIVFHLAAIVSSHAESSFDLGYQINLDVTRRLLEACRQTKEGIRFIFSSSLAVFGGPLPEVVKDTTAVTPQSSYGIQKAIGELLVNDYSRKGFVDGRVLRLPTICVRPGKPNKAASSFVSSIIREPLQGEEAICPVSTDLSLWLSSPETVIENILHAATIPAQELGAWRTVNLPGIHVTVQDMLEALERQAGAATLARVRFEPDENINRIVSSWPGRIDNSRALQLGFRVDGDFDGFIRQFMQNDWQKTI
ncbi:D-erythronate dehydrogenase [Telluribacter sp.]|jgi:nucleoside-diphosphate-sugar epimerase|uniref:D-erythronate dehydrogenase n=1 Tax=Telluribacter sp. TaxID=1978767 RepID=UPI002E10462F|nr:D-erythronate dehydrogenase [Telluribacter sp.]